MSSEPNIQKSSSRIQKYRGFKDSLARYIVNAGGYSVILAICLIFLYLLYEVVPLFYDTEVTKVSEYVMPGDSSKTLYLSTEGRLVISTRVTEKGKVYFFNTNTGKVTHTEQIKLPNNSKIISFYKTEPNKKGIVEKDEELEGKEIVVFGLDTGEAIIARHFFEVSHDEKGNRIITAKLDYPFSGKPIVISKQKRLEKISAEWDEDGISIITHDSDGKIKLSYLEKASTLDEDEPAEFEQSQITITELAVESVKQILVNKEQKWVYVLHKNNGLSFYDISDKKTAKLLQHIPSLTPQANVSDMRFLVGGTSLLIGTDAGKLMQWFPVRDQNNNYSLIKIREFSQQNAKISSISTEYSRKGFAAVDSKGHLAIYHSTADRILYNEFLTKKPILAVYLAPRADAVLIETVLVANQSNSSSTRSLQFWHIKNNHPEVSWSSLWGKVWYENHPEEKWIWQSTASHDVEPKFSLMPLSFGTLKAAFYAMLISIPLAILGAIFTAYFMASRMRKVVKPSIEIMEALPTVIIGFLAGLWLAPLVDKNLTGVFLILATLPLGILLASYYWNRVPSRYRHKIPDGWEAALLIPVIILVVWLTFNVLGPIFDNLFFDGSMSHWLGTGENKIDYKQRNSIIIGLAMGFAVIPTIFSIAEDAIFAVPKHLTQGSLALGATAWQTLSRVVLLTASPGMFSAVMIGFGRAIGETMIILMATGNTAIMDGSIFTGMRTLSSNIATELPEAAQHSTHFRILFLTALVLFLFTFVFNTIAEIVRQRLRNKYSNL